MTKFRFLETINLESSIRMWTGIKNMNPLDKITYRPRGKNDSDTPQNTSTSIENSGTEESMNKHPRFMTDSEKKQILELRSLGLTYSVISDRVGRSKTGISNYLSSVKKVKVKIKDELKSIDHAAKWGSLSTPAIEFNKKDRSPQQDVFFFYQKLVPSLNQISATLEEVEDLLLTSETEKGQDTALLWDILRKTRQVKRSLNTIEGLGKQIL